MSASQSSAQAHLESPDNLTVCNGDPCRLSSSALPFQMLIRHVTAWQGPPIISPSSSDLIARLRSLYSASIVPFSDTYSPSKNFRISLFLTLQACWMSAADCETFSTELPVSSIWSLTPLEGSTSTPSSMRTRRTIFSPRKFLRGC